MADRPLIMSAPMVRALLAGTKTQTRQVLRPQRGTTISDATLDVGPAFGGLARRLELPLERLAVPYAVGMRLWVREAWAPLEALTHNDPGVPGLIDGGFYRADGNVADGEISRWRPSIHMPRWASRLTLTVSNVRVERLNEISEADAIDEGAHTFEMPTQGPPSKTGCPPLGQSPRRRFQALWTSLHGPDSWSANPWVVAVSFEVEHRNIDAGRRALGGE